MGRIPYRIGCCLDCGLPDKMLITKRCFDQPNFCYQNYKEQGQREKLKVKVRDIAIHRIKEKSDNDIPKLIQKAVTVFHSWIKRRDSFNGLFKCISCDDVQTSDRAQCGHYLPAGNNAAVRFHEHNSNSQCDYCNITLVGNQANYRIALIKKIGKQNVLSLEYQAKQFFKWDREYLINIINKYKF